MRKSKGRKEGMITKKKKKRASAGRNNTS